MTTKPKTETIRAALKDTLGVDIGVKMAESIQAALDSTKTEWFECRHCHKKNPLVFPNAFERAKACQLVIEQLEGKVGTHREAPQAARKPTANLDEMSDDDLLALLQEPEVSDDGETHSSPTEETAE